MNKLRPIDLDSLDPGIRRTVALLRSLGFDTLASVSGFPRPSVIVGSTMDYPHVAVLTSPDRLVHDTVRLQSIMANHGVKLVPQGREGATLCGTYDPADGSALLLLAGVDDAALGLGLADAHEPHAPRKAAPPLQAPQASTPAAPHGR